MEENVSDFYANHYRKICDSDDNLDPEYFFNSQYVGKRNRFDFIKIHSQKKLKNLKIVDLGGGAGGILDHFKGNNNQLFLVDSY